MTLFKAVITSATRRHAEICDENLKLELGKLGSRSVSVCVGDNVICEKQKDEIIITKVENRKNIFKRSYQHKVKELAANLDHLFIVSAVGALFNTVFIDRVLATALAQSIPVSLVINKIDLEVELKETLSSIELYRDLGFSLITISTKNKIGLDAIQQVLDIEGQKRLAFTGISGVGKSSLINYFLPKASVRTQIVSDRTGQGRQTTSQSFAHLYPENSPRLFLIDMPGVQNFGVTHLSEDQVKAAFGEFNFLSQQCKFSGCWHLNEPKCAVTLALSENRIATSRYENYKDMLIESRKNLDY